MDERTDVWKFTSVLQDIGPLGLCPKSVNIVDYELTTARDLEGIGLVTPQHIYFSIIRALKVQVF